MKTRLLPAAFTLSLALLLSPSLLHAQTISFKPVTKFHYPGASSTGAYGINDAGDVVGGYVLPGADYANGFLRHADGTFESIVYPGSTVYQTFATAINNQGVIAGWYNTDNPVVTHGFLLTNGVYTSFDYPTAAITNIYGINDAGDFVGNYTMPGGAPYHGFASIGGQLSEVTVPGTNYVEPHDINNNGDIVGWANTMTASYGFRLQSDGTLRYPITPSPNTFASLLGTSDTKESVGTEGGSLPAALYYGGGNTFIGYNVPGLTFNQFTGINHRGLICGYGYDDAAGILYSYLVRRVITGSAQ